jgi:hypothetical protein
MMVVHREHIRMRPKCFKDQRPQVTSDRDVATIFRAMSRVIKTLHTEYGTKISHSELYLFVLIRDYMLTTQQDRISKIEAYEEAILPYWYISYPTFNRRFNRLVQLHYFNSLNFRGTGKFGYSELYAPTIRQMLLAKIFEDQLSLINSH